MWPRQSHTLAPLTRLMCINRTFIWTEVEQDVFNKINRVVDHNTLLTYPGFN